MATFLNDINQLLRMNRYWHVVFTSKKKDSTAALTWNTKYWIKTPRASTLRLLGSSREGKLAATDLLAVEIPLLVARNSASGVDAFKSINANLQLLAMRSIWLEFVIDVLCSPTTHALGPKPLRCKPFDLADVLFNPLESSDVGVSVLAAVPNGGVDAWIDFDDFFAVTVRLGDEVRPTKRLWSVNARKFKI